MFKMLRNLFGKGEEEVAVVSDYEYKEEILSGIWSISGRRVEGTLFIRGLELNFLTDKGCVVLKEIPEQIYSFTQVPEEHRHFIDCINNSWVMPFLTVDGLK